MTSSRWRLALVALLPLLIAPPATATATATGPSRSGQGVVDVKFGQTVRVPAEAGNRARATLRFSGRKDEGLVLHGISDYVYRCDLSTLSSGGNVVKRSALGMWLFPRTGTYTLKFDDRCPSNVSPGGVEYVEDVDLTLKRLILHQRRLGKPLRTRTTKSSVHAALVRLRTRSDAVHVSYDGAMPTVEPASRLFRERFVPDADARAEDTCHSDYLQIGQRLRNWYEAPCAGRVRRNKSYVVFGGSSTRLEEFRTIRTSIDAAKPPTWRGARPVQLQFTGRAGSVVRIDAANLRLLADGGRAAELRRQDGRKILPLGNTTSRDGAREVWRLPTDGRYLFDLTGSPRRVNQAIRVTVRSVDSVALQPGVPVTLPVEGDQWVVALLPEASDSHATVTVSGVTPATPSGWQVVGLGMSDSGYDLPALMKVGVGEPFSYGVGIALLPGGTPGSGSVTAQLDLVP